MRVHKLALVIAIYSLSLVGCTKPSIIKEPYPVEVVREVVIPIPEEYTRELETPKLPDTGNPVTVLHLVTAIKEWQAWGKVANEHRGKVARLSKGQK